MWGSLLLNKMRGLECKHDALIVDLIITMATKWLVDGTLWTDDDPCPGEDGAGWCEISSYFSEQLTIWKLMDRLLLEIFHWIFLDLSWPRVTETVGSKTAGRRGRLYILKNFKAKEIKPLEEKYLSYPSDFNKVHIFTEGKIPIYFLIFSG